MENQIMDTQIERAFRYGVISCIFAGASVLVIAYTPTWIAAPTLMTIGFLYGWRSWRRPLEKNNG